MRSCNRAKITAARTSARARTAEEPARRAESQAPNCRTHGPARRLIEAGGFIENAGLLEREPNGRYDALRFCAAPPTRTRRASPTISPSGTTKARDTCPAHSRANFAFPASRTRLPSCTPPRREWLCRAFYWHPHENLFWVQAFDISDELRQELLEFHVTCNSTWLIEQYDIKPAAGVRAEQLSPTDLAA